MASRRVSLPLWPGSDGDPTHVPKNPGYSLVDPPALYLEKVGMLWSKDRAGSMPDVTYILERLPPGYTLYSKPRPSDPKIVDKWLYGHPSHKVFDSPNRFYAHFKHLMENGGNSMGCPCTVCNAMGGIILPMGTKVSKHFMQQSRSGSSDPSGYSTPMGEPRPRGRPKNSGSGRTASRFDEEGTPDVYRHLINKLRSQQNLDEEIEEPLSVDWRAEQEALPKRIRDLKQHPQWQPREGDLVLFVENLKDEHELCLNRSGSFILWDRETGTSLGSPAWEAGLVSQPPAEATVLDDLVLESEKKLSVSYSGVRIEPLPGLSTADKSLSKRYRYLPIRNIRPFIFWRELVGETSDVGLHPTITNALSVTSTVSLWGKHRFRGVWPEAYIYCHGLYLGPEMLGIGDVVRLLPKSDAQNTEVTDVLVIKSIRLKLSSLDVASDNDYDEGRPHNSHIYVFGKAYTLDASRSNGNWTPEEDSHTLPTVMQDYGPWYPLHPSNKEMQTSFTRVLGRLYEFDAMALWLPHVDATNEPLPPNLTHGLAGLIEAREYARCNDQRIASTFGSTWYWAESRADALDLETVNGLEVAKHNQGRDPKKWRKTILKMEEVIPKPSSARTRDLRRFMAPQLRQSLPLRASPAHSEPSVTAHDEHTDGTHSTTGESSRSSRKRANTPELGSDDEAIRAATKIIEDDVRTPKKKFVPSVVIG